VETAVTVSHFQKAVLKIGNYLGPQLAVDAKIEQR
jgi:hypothetical protein